MVVLIVSLLYRFLLTSVVSCMKLLRPWHRSGIGLTVCPESCILLLHIERIRISIACYSILFTCIENVVVWERWSIKGSNEDLMLSLSSV